MPREDRRIMFDFEETYKAIYAICVQRGEKKPPPGIVKSIAPAKDNNAQVTVFLENPQINKAEEINFTLDFLAAALMLYCRSCGIPLPKGAQKSVELEPEQVVLRVMIS